MGLKKRERKNEDDLEGRSGKGCKDSDLLVTS